MKYIDYETEEANHVFMVRQKSKKQVWLEVESNNLRFLVSTRSSVIESLMSFFSILSLSSMRESEPLAKKKIKFMLSKQRKWDRKWGRKMKYMWSLQFQENNKREWGIKCNHEKTSDEEKWLRAFVLVSVGQFEVGITLESNQEND